ncbi:hypothetical protein Q9233_014700 [Columba guinea]|nr:hypothetical protein Q9233_014700 [Columba guinea]
MWISAQLHFPKKGVHSEGSAGVVVCSRVYVLFDGFWFAFQESSIARSEKEATLTKEAAASLRQTLLASPSTENSPQPYQKERHFGSAYNIKSTTSTDWKFCSFIVISE